MSLNTPGVTVGFVTTGVGIGVGAVATGAVVFV